MSIPKNFDLSSGLADREFSHSLAWLMWLVRPPTSRPKSRR